MGVIRFAGGRVSASPPAENQNPNANYLLTGVQQPPHDGETYDYNDWTPAAVIEICEDCRKLWPRFKFLVKVFL